VRWVTLIIAVQFGFAPELRYNGVKTLHYAPSGVPANCTQTVCLVDSVTALPGAT
jgi:hypothetical protein